MMIEVPNGRLHAVSDGPVGGQPVVLIHAGIADLRAWDEVVGYLSEAGFRSIRFDIRGFGDSKTEDVEYFPADDVVAVMNHYAIEVAPLVGNSFGGMIAFDTALAHPKRVSAVVGVGAGISGYWGEPSAEEAAIFDRMEKLSGDPTTDPEGIVALDLEFWVEGPGQRQGRVNTAVRRAVEEMDRKHWTEGKPHGKPGLRKPEASEHVTDLQIPVLAVAGMLDASDVTQTAEFLEQNAPNARAVLIPDVAHMIGMEIPKRLARLVIDFLGNV